MDALEKANSSKTIRELLKFEESQTITLSEIMLRIEEKLQELSIKYHSIKKNTDLLLYICLATFTKNDLFKISPNCKDWRSVSICTNAKQAMVLYADQSAPGFLKDKVRHLINKPFVKYFGKIDRDKLPLYYNAVDMFFSF